MRFFWLYLFQFLLLSTIGVEAKPNSKTKFYNIEEGLSHSSILVLFEDSHGYVWAGTRNGLNKYNGYGFDVFEPTLGDSTSLNNPFINSIQEDSKGDLWIGTANGLSHYQRDLNQFVNYLSSSRVENGMEDDNILDVFIDENGQLWLATPSGVFVFDPTRKEVVKKVLSGSYIESIFQDSSGVIWAVGNGIFISTDKLNFSKVSIEIDGRSFDVAIKKGIEGPNGDIYLGSAADGLFHLQRKGSSFQFTQFVPDERNANSLGHNRILDLTLDSKGGIWIGTENGGLDRYDTRLSQFHHYNHDPKDPSTISSMSIWAILEDHLGRIWIGNFSSGIDLIDPYQKAFVKITSDVPNTINGKAVKGFAEDSQGNIWIGMDGFGLAYYDKRTNKYTHYAHDPNDNNSLSNNAVLSIAIDDNDNLLVGCWDGGLNLVDARTKRVERYLLEPGNAGSPKSNLIYRVLQDKKNRSGFWIGTWGEGLDYFDVEKRAFIHPRFDNEELIFPHVFTSRFDLKGNLWIGTEKGLNKIEDADIGKINHVVRYESDRYDPKSISENYVSALFCDSNGRMWIGTGNGLNVYVDEENTFRNFTKSNGLSSSSIMSILEDNEGNLWLGTTRGISKGQIKETNGELTLSFTNYDKKDGLQGDFFKIETALNSSDGTFYFGGNNGFNRFNPNLIVSNPNLSKVEFTDLKIFNKTVEIGDQENGILKRHISSTEEINLTYKHKVITIDFIAVNYTRPEKNEYAYMMEGFDDDWIFNGNQRSATFTSLPPGSYAFRVKASNNDGVWNEKDTSITINVAPPWWETMWFRSLVIIILALIGVLIVRYRQKLNRLQKKLLQERLDEAVTETQSMNSDLSRQNENLKSSIEETNKIINAAVESGNLNERISTEGKEGQWKDLSDSINRLFDSVVNPFNSIDAIVSKMANGDLTQQMEENTKGDLLRLAKSFNKAVLGLNQLMIQITNYSDRIEQASEEMKVTGEEMNVSTGEIVAAISQMSSGAQKQVAEVDETSNVVENIKASTEYMSETADQINETAVDGVKNSSHGREVIGNISSSMEQIFEYSYQTDSSMQVLKQRSNEISKVLGVITEIASQTNLLALNAAIEAAQAGDAGRGFAVVAEEIRKLAESSKNSTKAIEELIGHVQKDTDSAANLMTTVSQSVKKGVEEAKAASEVFNKIANNSNRTLELAQKITDVTQEQIENVDRVASSISSVVVVAEQTAAGTEEIATSAQELAAGMENYNQKSNRLNEIASEQRQAVGEFVLKDEKLEE